MERIIIFGVARQFRKLFLGDDMYEWMKEKNISVAGIASKDSDKFGQRVKIADSTYEIKHIGDFPKDSYDYILVTSGTYFEKIKKYLTNEGIPEGIVLTVRSFVDKIINDVSECKYSLSIAAIVKDEVDYIEEWIQFHLLMGVEHFYIYDNESSDGTAEVLKEYERSGLVTYIFWPGKGQQRKAYSNAIDRFKTDSIYIAFIDVDEFLFSVAGNKINDEIGQILNEYNISRTAMENVAAAIGVKRVTYGTSFHSNKLEDLVIRRFLFRKKGTAMGIKSVCNPRAVVRADAHHAEFLPGCCCISEKGSEIPGAIFRDGGCRRLRINHYASKSDEEFIKRKKKGDVVDNDKRQSEEYIGNALSSFQTEYNERYDAILLKYSSYVENAIKKFRSEHLM